MLARVCVCALRHRHTVNIQLSYHAALRHAERGSVHDDHSFRRSGSVMPLTMQRISNMGSDRPYPGQLWKRDSRQVLAVAVSPTTVTYDDLDRNGRPTESLDAFVSAFRRMKR